MGMYFVGIDGGGTSCRARIKDSQGNFLAEGARPYLVASYANPVNNQE